MRNFLLVTLLATACSSAAAEWVKVGSNETDTVYADPVSIIRTSYKVKMRSMHDFKNPAKVAGDSFLSAAMQQEYDCRENEARTLVLVCHSRNMGKGRKVFTDMEPHEWAPVKRGSIREALLKFACK